MFNSLKSCVQVYVPLQKLGIVKRKLCGIVITLEAQDAGEWECILNVEGYQQQTRKKINIR